MNSSFNKWVEIGNKDINTVADYILTGRKVKDFKPENYLFKYIGNKDESLIVLDFGCGIGRNTFGLGEYSNKWNVWGYDNDNMLYHINNYCNNKYNKSRLYFSNVKFTSNWEELKKMKFDVIFACLVFQHIHEDDLHLYLKVIRTITNKLIVSGRRFNDDIINGKNKNTWEILEKNDFNPKICSLNEYNKEGDPEEHFTCVYEW
jgi:SAM-dependent methyltransferase